MIPLFIAGLTPLLACQKEEIKPSPTVPPKTTVNIDTKFITGNNVPADVYTVLTFRQNNAGSDYFWVKHCNEVGINAFFSSDYQTRVEVYKTGDGTENFVWMGNVTVNPADSSLVISKITGSDSLGVVNCNSDQIQIFDL